MFDVLFLAQQGDRGGRDIAEAVTDVHGSVWLLIAVGAIFLSARFMAKTFQTAVLLGALIGMFVLMDGPGMSGSGIEERWNDIKAKAEAFWNAEDVRFRRGADR